MNYPNSPGYARNSDTSREAADRLTSKKALVDLIVNYLEHHQIYDGSTVDEAVVFCQQHLERKFDRSTIAARFTELEAQGVIVRTNDTRQSARGRRAAVYVHKHHAPAGAGDKRTPCTGRKSPREQHLEALAGHLMGAIKSNRQKDGFACVRLTPLDLNIIDNMARKAGVEC